MQCCHPCISYLLCITPKLWFKTRNIYYITATMRQESRHSLAWYLWFMIYHEVAIQLLARLQDHLKAQFCVQQEEKGFTSNLIHVAVGKSWSLIKWDPPKWCSQQGIFYLFVLYFLPQIAFLGVRFSAF